MECENCGYKFDDIFDECEYEIINSGSQFNHEFGQVEHYFSGNFTCPECEHVFAYSDSSL